jgi:hypothetical protein
MYPGPVEQAKAVTAFGGMGVIGIGMYHKQFSVRPYPDRVRNPVLGLIISVLFVSFVSWPWVFHFIAMMSSVIGLIFVPKLRRTVSESRAEKILRFRRLDFLGIFMTSKQNYG